MPFRQYSGFFQPEEIAAFTAAYNAAWLQLWAGERDVERLKEIELRGVSGKAQRRLEWAEGGP